jgi:hypothetical protein
VTPLRPPRSEGAQCARGSAPARRAAGRTIAAWRAEIGASLGISAKTVESDLTRIFERIHVASRTELALFAVREGWVENV